MFKTIKSKFIITSIIFVIIGVGGPATFLILQFRENFNQRSVMMLETNLNVINSSINYAMLNQGKDIQKVVEEHLSDNVSAIRIFDKSGTIKYSSNESEIGTDIKLIPAHHHLDLSKQNIILIDSEEIYSGIKPIKNTKKCQACHGSSKPLGYLDLDFHLSEAETYFYTGVRHTLFLSVTMIAFLITGLYIIFNRFINKPLQNVMHGLDEVEKGNLSVRQKVDHEDEFGLLNSHFNNMVERLQKSLIEIDQFHFNQLQRADKLVTLGELAAEMAHEINNPTGVIMTRADFLKLESEENGILKKYNDDIRVIINQAEKIATITRSVLKYSKKRQQEFEQMNLLSTVEGSLNLFAPSLEKRNIKVQSRFISNENCGEPVTMGNQQQIEQVITNILNNSIDAVDSNGNIGINIKCSDKKYIELVIEDDGPGIDPEVQEQIFLPFFTTKSDKNGTGLGLYIVKNICQHHDAEISCDSKLNRGTKFIIRFKQVINP